MVEGDCTTVKRRVAKSVGILEKKEGGGPVRCVGWARKKVEDLYLESLQ